MIDKVRVVWKGAHERCHPFWRWTQDQCDRAHRTIVKTRIWLLGVGAVVGLAIPELPAIFSFLARQHTPHAFSYRGDPYIFWPWVLSDIALVFLCAWIPFQLLALYRSGRIEKSFAHWFAAFIWLCGVKSGIDALAQWWWPAYASRAWASVFTAVTTLVIVLKTPKMLLGFTQQFQLLESAREQAEDKASRLRPIAESAHELYEQIVRTEALAEIVENNPMLILRNNHEVFLSGNAALEEFLGRPVEGLPVAWWIENLVHPDDRQRTIDFHESGYVKGLKLIRFVNRIQGSDGQFHTIEWTATTSVESQTGWAMGLLDAEVARVE